MLGDKYEICLYAPEGPHVPGAELVPCLSRDRRLEIFGFDNRNNLAKWPTAEQSLEFNVEVTLAIQKRIEQKDLILLSGGATHSTIANMFQNHIVCEPGVGYEGIITERCAFESYAWMHYLYGQRGIKDGRWFDCVIPNFFDPEDFRINNASENKYLLFLGRLIGRKGPQIASEIAEAVGIPLVVAGPGGEQVGDDIVAPEITIKNAMYEGPVNRMQRKELLADAYAVVCPTTYIEPFGGVAVEAMMSGTPVIASDWGAFVETVKPEVSGFRFRTLKEAIAAVKNLKYLNRETIRDYALSNYSLSAVAPKFQSWFNRLSTLWDKGWYQV